MEELATREQEPNVLRRNIKDDPRKVEFAEHRVWMAKQQHEYPLPSVPYRVGYYIRFHNQTKHDDYLEYHKTKCREDIALCPLWTLVDIYIDSGARAPRMENSPELCRLLTDCINGKVDLIITQLVANLSSDPDEIALMTRMLAAQDPPVGIYCISEDIYSLASYYRSDMFDGSMLPPGWESLPPDELDEPMIYVPRIDGAAQDDKNDEGQ